MEKNLNFSELVEDFGEPITSIELHTNRMFGNLHVLVVNNGKTEWFIAKEVMRSIGYKTVGAMGRLLSRVVRPSEIRIIRSSYDVCHMKLPYKVSSKGLYLLSELGVYDLILNSNIPNAIEYKLWVAGIVKEIHHNGIYRCEINEANKQLENIIGTCNIPRFDLSPYQQNSYIDVISIDPYGNQEIDKDYKLRIINLSFFLTFYQTYSNLDPQSSYTGDMRPFDIAYKFGGSQLVNIIISNIQFVMNQLTCGCSLLLLENWIYGFYPIGYTPKYNIQNGTEIQKMISNNDEKQTRIIDAEILEN